MSCVTLLKKHLTNFENYKYTVKMAMVCCIIYLFNILISSYFIFMSTTPCECAIANPISLSTPKVRPKILLYFKFTLIVSISTYRAINLSAQSYLKVDLLLILKLDLLEIVFFSFE